MLASARGHLVVVRLLCEAGADKDTADQDGATALMRAIRRGQLEMVRLLCEVGADKDKADQHGNTAFMLASQFGHLEMVRLLCEAGADKDKAIGMVTRPSSARLHAGWWTYPSFLVPLMTHSWRRCGGILYCNVR